MTGDRCVLDDPHDARAARSATGLLAAFNEAGVLERRRRARRHPARPAGRRARRRRAARAGAGRARGAARLGVRRPRRGRGTVLGEGDEPVDVRRCPGPTPRLDGGVRREPARRGRAGRTDWRPLRLVDGLLYLDRYWRQEEVVRPELADARAAAPPTGRPRPAARRAATGCSPTATRGTSGSGSRRRWPRCAGHGARRRPGHRQDDHRRADARAAARPARRRRRGSRWPRRPARRPPGCRRRCGTAGRRRRARRASTLHRLLGWRPGRSRFRHDRDNRLPFDVVVVDETSMVSLTMMARLLEALRPDARLVLVGDPDQLASVEAGAVLGDLARAPGRPEPHLDAAADRAGPARRAWSTAWSRWITSGGSGGAIAEFARAVQAGDADAAVALLRGGTDDLRVRRDRVRGGAGRRCAPTSSTPGSRWPRRRGARTSQAALAALERHRVLCAHRRGPYGVARWSRRDRAVAGRCACRQLRRARRVVPRAAVLVTANDYDTGLFNGDTGVVVATAGRPAGRPSPGPPACSPRPGCRRSRPCTR